MIVKNNELQLTASNELLGVSELVQFFNDLETQQDLLREVDKDGRLIFAYDHAPHIHDVEIPNDHYDTYLNILYESITALLKVFNVDTACIDDLLIICSTYRFVQSALQRAVQRKVGLLEDAKLLIKLLLVPFPPESKYDLDGMNEEQIHNFLADFRRDKATKYLRNGVLDRSLIEPEYFSILSMLERGIKIDIEARDNKGNKKWYYILFSPWITTSIFHKTDSGKQPIALTKSQNSTLLRSFLKDLINDQAARETEFFNVIKEPAFNNKRKKLLAPFIHGREEATHNQVLRIISNQLATFLINAKLTAKPKRRGIYTKDTKVMIYYLFSLQSLLLVNKETHLHKSPDALRLIVQEFKHMSDNHRSMIAAKFSEIIK